MSRLLGILDTVAAARAEWTRLRDKGTKHLSGACNELLRTTYVGGGGDGAREEVPESAPRCGPLAAAVRARCLRRAGEQLRKLEATVEAMIKLVGALRRAADECAGMTPWPERPGWSAESDAVGESWTLGDVSRALARVADAYCQEASVKACVADDVLRQKDNDDVLMSYAAAFLAEPYLDDNEMFAVLEAARHDLQLAVDARA